MSSHSAEEQPARRPAAAAAPLVLGALVLLLLGDLIFAGGGLIASHAQGDGVRFFFYQRDFGFGELRSGNLPLWNPHVFAGTPFVGAFQASIFYPPSWVHLLVPVAVGINLEFALSIWILALGAFYWARARELSVPAALLCAAVVGFGATAWLRVLAGALSVLATYAWVPWLMLCIDALARRVTLGWLLATTFAASMLLLAGHPPTALMAGFVLTLYLVPAWLRSGQRLRLVAALGGAGCLALAIAGVQLALGYDVSLEGVRREGVDFEFATSWSFPPENLLTLFVPALFGDAPTPMQVMYFGRWWYWDDVAFVGVVVSVLAVAGAMAAKHPSRRTALWLAGILIVLALGRYTPIYRLVFEVLPGFDLIRAPSKFMFFATLFVALLAGMGLDRLRDANGQGGARRGGVLGSLRSLHAGLALGAGLAGVGLLTIGWWTLSGAAEQDLARSPVTFLAALGERADRDPRAVLQWARMAGVSLFVSGASLLVVALVVGLSERYRSLVFVLFVVAMAELLWFALQHRGGIPPDLGVRQRAWLAEVVEQAGARRLMEVGVASSAPMGLNGYGVWGYDPVVLDRYAAFMARSQGSTAAEPDNVLGSSPSRSHPLLRLVRLGVLVVPDRSTRSFRVEWVSGPLPRLLFVDRYVVETDREAILDRLDAEDFDPRQQVVLEAPPAVAPSLGVANATARIVAESTDHLDIEADLATPAILLVTDAYAEGWRATPLPGSVQRDYVVQPANLVLRAIALEAGRHRIRLEYVPPHFRLGQAASVLGIGGYLVGVGVWWGRRRRRSGGV